MRGLHGAVQLKRGATVFGTLVYVLAFLVGVARPLLSPN